MNWNQFAQDVHRTAVANGLWDKPPSFAEFIVLCHADLSKAAEEYLARRPIVYYSCGGGRPCIEDGPNPEACPIRQTGVLGPDGPCYNKNEYPSGPAVHLADCVLRILDYLAAEGFDFDDAISIKRQVPGGLIEAVSASHDYISSAHFHETNKDRHRCVIRFYTVDCISTIFAWAARNNVDMESILQARHTYNKSRIRPAGGDKPQEVAP